MAMKVRKTEREWKKSLSPEKYKIMRKGLTERPFTGQYNEFWEKGTYACAACGTSLFRSEAKYEHGTGWPSFSSPADDKALEYRDDYSLLMKRVEVRCAACGSHLGHVFDDGPAPSFLHYCINSGALDFQPDEPEAAPEASRAGETKPGSRRSGQKGAAAPAKATFAAGCFWGVEFKLSRLGGVTSTVVGYTGGEMENPTYEDVCTGRTGHAEAVQVTFDPHKISYEQLVRRFFAIHDPTQVNRQGPDRGTQYRSAIFYHDENQRLTARRVMDEIQASGRFDKPLATELVPASTFFKAEEYHQKYFEKHGIACG
jgi:peptide methionine sulfoxide reductase msrA/msrB